MFCKIGFTFLSELSVLCYVLTFGVVAVEISNVSALFHSCGAVR